MRLWIGLARVRPIPRARAAGVRDERGAAALEFALVVPVLLLLLMGIIEFGFMFQDQLALTHAAREGARLASVGKWDPAVVVSRAYPITPTIATVPVSPATAKRGDSITVTLTYNYDWTVLPFPGTVPLKGKAVMRRE